MQKPIAMGVSKLNNHSHLRWMRSAIHQAKLAQGRVAENPPVGCVLLDYDENLVAVGHTQPSGRPHAETSAIEMVKRRGQYHTLKGGTAYVSLEPCSHVGQTAPCANALIEAGLKTIYIAIEDPDPRVSGRGIEMLRKAGLQVHVGLCATEAETVMCGFLSQQRRSRPFVTSKIATSSDGFIAKTPHKPTRLTNAISQHFVHDLRGRVDAIITGVGTILADNPQLNIRYCGKPEHTPLRLVLDSTLRTPLDSHIFDTNPEKVIICHTKQAPASHINAYDKEKKLRHCFNAENGMVNIAEVLEFLTQMQINHVLLEAGAGLNHHFLNAGFIDKLIWLKAPIMLESGLGLFSRENKITSHVDFSLPNSYIKQSEISLGCDNLSIWQNAVLK